MSAAKSNPAKSTEVVPSLTAVLGVIPILPGESDSEYRQGLQSLIEELEAKTVMQVYLAEKIFECLWWMRRYEQQKRATLVREMARILCSGASYKLSDDEAQVMELIMASIRPICFSSNCPGICAGMPGIPGSLSIRLLIPPIFFSC